MAETLTPNRVRLQSPTSPFQLGSNDDQLERARARAARAASVRRKSVAQPLQPDSPHDPCFSKQQISELFHNCIKLASENKINQKNTWELTLIDHISEIIKEEVDDDTETNFQKASCTLEAGVKIYASRVDSVHSEAYKVLGGINRAGRGDHQEIAVDGDNMSGQEDGHSKKEIDKKTSPLSTLESSFESLNVKKFDVAFSVDPLYHQTSAQFDEGGAKGLLLNNLGVYGCCRLVFDSSEIPGKSMFCEPHSDKSDKIDVSFAKEHIDQMLINIPAKREISPTLRIIINQFNDDNVRPPNTFSEVHEEGGQDEAADHNHDELDNDIFENGGDWGHDQDDRSSLVDESTNYAEPAFSGHQEDYDSYAFHEPEIAENFDNVADFLFLGLGFTSNRNAWAGPDHWKFQKVKCSKDNPVTENGSPVTAKKPKYRKQAEPDISFVSFLDKEIADIFAPPKSSKSLLLPVNRVPCNTKLPEDCHYHPENLVKLFLLPNTICLGKRARKLPDESRGSDFGPLPSWEDENAFGGQFDDGNVHSDMEDSITLVSQPRQVNKIEVKYDKTSKQVDVHALKGTLWNHIKELAVLPETGKATAAVSFKGVLSSFPDDCEAAPIEEISPHLCFICLLHLANENGLRILGCPNLDDLHIEFPGVV